MGSSILGALTGGVLGLYKDYEDKRKRQTRGTG
jgi:hypothetical protein